MRKSRHRIRRATIALLFATAAVAADVRSFDAKGDGQADDSASIQRAVDAGGSVQFPSGIYRLSRTVTINLEKTGPVALIADGTARIVMAGAGPAFQFIGTHAGSAAPETFKPNVLSRQSSPRVDGLDIVGAHPEADGIAAHGTMQLTITRVVVREARHAIHLHGRNRNVIISDCHLYHNRGIGVYYDAVSLHQSNITGSHISYNAGGGVVTRGGDVRNIQIGNCDIEANMAADAPPTANVLIDSTGGSTGEVGITGCTIQHTMNAPGSANIRVIGGGRQSSTVNTPTTEGNITISGNILSDVQVNIHLQSVRDVTITGNTFWMGADRDLIVEDSSNVIVGPNNFDRNPRYETGGRGAARGGVVFLHSRDCTLSGLHVNGVRHHSAAVLIDGCSRINLANATVLDCDGIGLQLRDTTFSRVGGCLIRDGRPAPNAAPALAVVGGHGNLIVDNFLDRRADLSAESGVARGNEVVAAPSRPPTAR